MLWLAAGQQQIHVTWSFLLCHLRLQCTSGCSTVTIVNGRWTGRAIKKDVDPLGRWSAITIAGKGRKVTFITAYQCCDGSNSNGPFTWYMQLWERHKKSGAKNPKPRTLFLDDLERYIHKIQEEANHYVDLGIDANEDVARRQDGIAKVARRCKLTDVMEHFHGNDLQPTYARSKNRIDYRFVSNELIKDGAITSCGALALHRGIVSDHVGIFIDYNEAKMLRTNTAELISVAARSLNSKSPQKVEMYLKVLKEQLTEHKILTRWRSLLAEERRTGMSVRIQRSYNNIESDWEDACRHAEASCTKRRKRGGHCFSPALDKAGRVVCYWKVRKSACLIGMDLPPDVERVRDSLGIKDDLSYNEEAVCQNLRIAWKALREQQSKAKQLRKSFLEERAELMSFEGNSTKEACYRSLISAEQSRELYSSLRFVVDKNPAGAIKRLQIPDPADPNCHDAKKCKKWLDVEDPDEMNEILMRRNKQQFRLAADTPFGDGELGELIQDPEVRESILQGTFDWRPFTDDEVLIALMDGMQHSDETRSKGTISLDVTAAQHVSKYRTMNENTSSSPSGLHRGHDLAHIQDERGSLHSEAKQPLSRSRKDSLHARGDE